VPDKRRKKGRQPEARAEGAQRQAGGAGAVQTPLLAHRKELMALLERANGCSNFALLLYRFADGSTKEKRQTLSAALAGCGNAALGKLSGLLDGIQQRQAAALAGLQEQKFHCEELKAKVAWRLVIGGSYGKVWDTSLQVHPLYGVPCLPASSIKGMLAHFVEENYASDSDRTRIFGTTDRQGEVIFLDAFCCSGARRYFEEDVIGKHYHEYYEKDPPGVPADYCEPEPVKFLAVAGGVEFVFRFASRERELVNKTKDWLLRCLAEYGIGAKTRVNYGRLKPSSSA